MSEFNKEEFLEEIHSFASWVKTGDDLMKYCRHIKYRMLQGQAIERWYQKNFKLTDEQCYELNKLVCEFDHSYGNHTSEFQPFNECFNVGQT